jgi:hypothetical protein
MSVAQLAAAAVVEVAVLARKGRVRVCLACRFATNRLLPSPPPPSAHRLHPFPFRAHVPRIPQRAQATVAPACPRIPQRAQATFARVDLPILPSTPFPLLPVRCR